MYNNLSIVFIILVNNKVKKIITKKVKASSGSEEDEEIQLKQLKKKMPSQLSQNSLKITRKVIPKLKNVVKVKPVIVENDEDSSPTPPTELKTKSSVFDRLGVGDVSSTTPNFDSNIPSTDSRKVINFCVYLSKYFVLFNFFVYYENFIFLQSSVFKRLGVKQTVKPTPNATFKRTIKGGSDAYYGPSIPSEESSAFTKRVKLEKTSKIYLFKQCLFLVDNTFSN